MIKFNPKTSRGQRGFSVAELLVALLLGLVVVGAVIQLFVGSRTTQMSTSAMGSLQENARFSFELLKDEFRGLGSYGFCAAKPMPKNHIADEDCDNYNAVYSFASDEHGDKIDRWDRPIVGWEYKDTGPGQTFAIESESDLHPGGDHWIMRLTNPDRDGAPETSLGLPEFLKDQVVPGSDVVVIRRLEPVKNLWPQPVQLSTNPVLNLSASHGLKENQLVMLTNCSKSDVFFNKGSGSTFSAVGGSCSDGQNRSLTGQYWATNYDDTAQVYAVKVHAYYVGYPDLDDDEDGREAPGLYRADLSHGPENIQTEELVQGVETLQVLYGYSDPVHGNGETVDKWYTAAQVPLWRYVIAARLGVVMRSSESMGGSHAESSTFELAGMEYTGPQDGRLRQPFHITISLRNRQVMIEKI